MPAARNLLLPASVLALGVAVVVGLAPAADAAPATATITGVVRTPSGLPLKGVGVDAVTIAGPLRQVTSVASAVTGADGSYRLTFDPRFDDPEVQFTGNRAAGGTSATGYADQCYQGAFSCQFGDGRAFSLRRGQTVADVDVALPPAAEIRGRTVDAAGRSVSGLYVTLKGNGSCFAFDDAPVLGSTTTDRNGNYAFTRLPAYPLTVCLGSELGPDGGPSPLGYVARVLGVTTRSGVIARPVTTLREGGGVSGRVVDADGDPVAGASVQLDDGSPSVLSSTVSDSGTFRLYRVIPGDQTFCVQAAGYTGTCDDTPTRPVTVQSGDVTNVGRIVLRRAS